MAFARIPGRLFFLLAAFLRNHSEPDCKPILFLVPNPLLPLRTNDTISRHGSGMIAIPFLGTFRRYV